MRSRLKIRTGMGVLTASIALASLSASAEEVVSIDFSGEGQYSQIEITGDSPLNYTKQINKEDKQVVIELKGAHLAVQASRHLDTSSFNSRVSLISPYEVQGRQDSRIVIQLRENAAADFSEKGNSIFIRVPNPGVAADATPPPMEASSAKTTAQAKAAASKPEIPDSDSNELHPSKLVEEDDVVDKVSTKSSGPKDRLDQFLESRQTKHFVGRPISLQTRGDADLRDIFRLIGDASGFNIVLGEGVSGNAPPLALTDVPWDQALDVVLRTKRLGAERFGNVLRIVTLENMAKEQNEELKAKVAAEANSPRITRIFPISYATLDDLATELKQFASATPAPANGVAAAPAGVVQVDQRTNSIIVRDTPENIERVRKLIELLDTQTPQVMIEAKIIEAGDSFGRQINGSFGFSGNPGGQSPYFTTFNGQNPVDPLFSTNNPINTGTLAGAYSNSSGGPGGGIGMSPTIGIFPSLLQHINLQLQMADTDTDTKIIASPKTVVLNKQKASILESTPVLISTTTQSSLGPVSTPQVQDANLSLGVTPTVTNDGGVLLDLMLSRDIAENAGQGQNGISKRNMQTKVLVPSGSTLVIGGIYTSDENNSSSGFPILKDIPIIGWLFGSKSHQTDRRELLFFISPRILNTRESGLQS